MKWLAEHDMVYDYVLQPTTNNDRAIRSRHSNADSPIHRDRKYRCLELDSFQRQVLWKTLRTKEPMIHFLQMDALDTVERIHLLG